MNTAISTIKELRDCLKNNCFRVYHKEGKNNIRVTKAKIAKTKLLTYTSKGWMESNFNKLIFS